MKKLSTIASLENDLRILKDKESQNNHRKNTQKHTQVDKMLKHLKFSQEDIQKENII